MSSYGPKLHSILSISLICVYFYINESVSAYEYPFRNGQRENYGERGGYVKSRHARIPTFSRYMVRGSMVF